MVNRNRFPSSRLPEGWFPVAWAHELAPGEVKALRYFDRDLVIWRTETGRVALQDAYCLHMGAHRGVGGEVVGENLACPFHRWEWSPEGTNTHIPYSTEGCKKRLQIRSFPIREWCGMIVAWYSDDPAKIPTWEPPEVPEYGRDDYYDMHPFSNQVFRIKTHVQMPAENAVDLAHLKYVHDTDEVPEPDGFTTQGHWLQSNIKIWYGLGREATRFTPDGPVHARVEMNLYGIGLSVVRFKDPVSSVQLSGFTPVDNDYIDDYFCMATERPEGSDRTTPTGVHAQFVQLQWRIAQQDFPIWENMTYLDRPSFAVSEAALWSATRRWASQFYPEEDRDALLATSGDG